MNPTDFVPRPDENFWAWLRRVDSATAELVHQSAPLADQHAAYRVGNALGSWATLYDCLKLLDDTDDARELLTLALAQQLGLRNRRDTVRTVDEFLAHLDGGEDRGPR
jgi:hypothetical protein